MKRHNKFGWNSQREFSYWVPPPDIEGEIPRDLRGTFIRNGPGLNEVYGKKLKHPIDGDGMVCKLSFDNGAVHFQSKFVKSKHRMEEEASKSFEYVGEMGSRNESKLRDSLSAIVSLATGTRSDIRFRNPSNTNAFYWGGKLLSLYETSLPYCLDPQSLETLGLDDLNGSLSLGSAGVHFRIDAEHMRLVMFSLRPGLTRLPSLHIVEYNSDWSIHSKLELNIPGMNYAHDFLLTPNYYVFHMSPFARVSMWQAFKILGGWTSPGESIKYHSDLPSKFIVIPRSAKTVEEVFFFDTPEPFHIYHYGPGGEKNEDTLVFTSVCLDTNFNMNFDQELWLSNTSVSPGYLYRHTLTFSNKSCVSQKIDKASVEFPTVHPFRHGRMDSSIAYLMASDREETMPFQDVVKVDVARGTRSVWYSDGVIGEPVFAPQLSYASRDDGEEDQGYVLVQLYKQDTHTTHFCVLDAQNISGGPVARIKLKHHVPYGFHGSFTPELMLCEPTPPPLPVFIKSKL